MFMEVAEIRVKAGTEPKFEAGVQKAVALFKRAKGCRAMRLERSVEEPTRYALLVEWETIDDHMVHFLESEDFQEWGSLVGEYFTEPPYVFHTHTVVPGF